MGTPLTQWTSHILGTPSFIKFEHLQATSADPNPIFNGSPHQFLMDNVDAGANGRAPPQITAETLRILIL